MTREIKAQNVSGILSIIFKNYLMTEVANSTYLLLRNSYYKRVSEFNKDYKILQEAGLS